MFVGRVNEVAQPVVDELLREGASLHVSVHVDFWHIETFVLQHRLHRDNVRMHLSPRERLDGSINDVGTIVADLKNAGH